jgi:hypothetical protein
MESGELDRTSSDTVPYEQDKKRKLVGSWPLYIFLQLLVWIIVNGVKFWFHTQHIFRAI